MTIPRHIFKAYDIRGLAETEVTQELARRLGRAYAVWLKMAAGKQELTVVVGRDMRDTSVPYQEALVAGLTESGVHVKLVGLVSTPAFYFAVASLGVDGGIQVSASHNPAEYNGFKLVRERAIPISGDSGIQEIADLIEQDTFEATEAGTTETIEGIPEKHVDYELEFAGDAEIKPLKVVMDPGNGMGAQYLELLTEKLPLEVTKLCWELDGNFPNHESNPFKPENIEDICAKVKEVGADLGIATDGDGDRIFFIDNNGKLVDPAIIRGILSQVMLRRHPGAKVGYDIRPGKITEDMIVEAGGQPFVTRVGHSLIKEHVMREGAVFGGESSGHFFYAFDIGVYEGPVVVTAHILQELTASQKTFAEFIAPLDRYSHSGEINFHVDDKDAKLTELKEKFADGELSELDGITITYPDFWFNVRPSNTESVLRLNLEAVDQETMETRKAEVQAIIEN